MRGGESRILFSVFFFFVFFIVEVFLSAFHVVFTAFVVAEVELVLLGVRLAPLLVRLDVEFLFLAGLGLLRIVEIVIERIAVAFAALRVEILGILLVISLFIFA